jgi:L-ribulose-5-phosphate 3-epimerase
MNRRTFLATSAAFAGSTLFTNAQDAAAKKRPKLKKAVNLGMCNIKGSLNDRFKAIKDAGFDGIELNLPDDGLTTDKIIEASKASGLEVAGIICTPHWSFPLSSPDPAKRERTVNGLKYALKQGGEIGCKSVLLVPGTVEKDVTYEQCWQRSIEGIKRCLETAEQSKCAIAVENVWNRFINEPVAAKRYLEEINSPLVGWHFDIGNCVTFGWPEHWVRTLGKKHLFNLHIKEYSRSKRDKHGPFAGFEVELMEGENDWPAVMKALDEVGYEGYGILEVGGGDATRLKFLAERTDKIFAC